MWDLRYQTTLEHLQLTKHKQKTRFWIVINQWWQKPRPLIFALCAATAEIIFLRGVGIGALLLTAMLLQPTVLMMGLMGVLAAVIFVRTAQLGETYLEKGAFLFNPLLAGLSVGYLFQPSGASLFLAAAAGLLAFLLTYTLAHVLHTYFLLPVLSLPFIAVSWIVHLAAFRYAGLQHLSYQRIRIVSVCQFTLRAFSVH